MKKIRIKRLIIKKNRNQPKNRQRSSLLRKRKSNRIQIRKKKKTNQIGKTDKIIRIKSRKKIKIWL